MARTGTTTRISRKTPTVERIRAVAAAQARQARAALDEGAALVRRRAALAIDRFERVFEDRVGRAIGTLGMPTARDVRALSRQVAQLQKSVEQLRRTRARA
jgi:poly(hydroxyalkanoate) granule-associated protein